MPDDQKHLQFDKRNTNIKSIFFLNPFPKRQILDSSKLKQFAGDNFNFDENAWKFSKRV